MPDKFARSSAQEHRGLEEFSIVLVAGLALAFTILFVFAVPIAGNLAASRDFVSYWATGQQLVHHANPYDRGAISGLEHSAGLTADAVLLMRNPPWALPLAYPLGFIGLRVAAIIWTLLLLGSLLISVRILRQLHGSPANRIHWLCLSFTPALICITMGQTTLFVLLGLALFLRFHRSRPFAAGSALWLCALKPHLLLPFIAALAAWIAVTHSYKLLAGAIASLVATSALAFLMDPHAWNGYLNMMRSPSVENDFIPCLAVVMRRTLHLQAAWPQYLPATFCCLWAFVYYWRRRRTWNWLTDSSPLLLVSLVAAPYCWFYDQCLAIPALMEAAYATRARQTITLLAALILLSDAQLCFIKVISPLWLWTAPAWLGWYLLARFGGKKSIPSASR